MFMWERRIVTVTWLSQTTAVLPMTQYTTVVTAVGTEKRKKNNLFFFVSSSTVLSFAQVCAGMLLLFLLAMGKGS